ncbi:PEP-CTERM sorting domain-containing protein [Sphingomonas bacterium]|uniref:PEP-CTERM sorting domain-containing protein n=1 Tax=Sphingomonas bacterium TaxID=1895847 RepID=UPI0015763520|nr:PEP-CTERM sorting domain-containing protein [Sphingomonas bacterium]
MTGISRSPVAAMLVAVAVPAQATITLVGTRSAFAAATSSQATDTFDDVAYGFRGTTLKRSAGSYSYTAYAPHGLDGDNGNADQWLAVDNFIDPLTFRSFSSGVAGIGGSFFGTAANGDYLAANIVVTATDADGSVAITLMTPAVDSFVGFVSTKAITQLTAKAVQPTGAIAWVGANNLVLASASAAAPVPEPATWTMALMGVGLVGAGLRGRRSLSRGKVQRHGSSSSVRRSYAQ